MTAFFWVIVLTTFVTVVLFTYGVLSYYNNRKVVRDRFKKSSAEPISLMFREDTGNSLRKQFLDWISSLGSMVGGEKKDTGKLRQMLIQAGFRNPKGPAIYFGLRILFGIMLPMFYLVFSTMRGGFDRGNFLVFLALAGIGFYGVSYGLTVITRRRQDRIDKGLPDVLDLLIVCMEAGLSLQATLNRVSEEVKSISIDLYKELQLTNAEMRTGIHREVALKNLGERTGVQNVKALVGLMIQSDRMGASIVQSLRTHAAFLRVQRSQRAEETAAKLPVKLLFPMVIFIFPAIFVVVLGPAALQITKSALFSGH
jgi:tight adherence protein C